MYMFGLKTGIFVTGTTYLNQTLFFLLESRTLELEPFWHKGFFIMEPRTIEL